jgi:O-antigen/teichoic acid export membrane protein
MDYFALVSIIDAVLKLAICFIIQFFGEDKLFTYGWLILAISLTNFIMYFIYARIKFKKLRLNFHIDKPLFKSMLSFSGWSLLNPLAYTARGQGCNMVLNYFFGPVLNAAHSVANQIANAVEQMSKNFSISFRPQIIQSYACGEYKRTKRLMFSMSKILYLLHAVFAIPIILEINNLLSLWLGKDSIPEYAAPFACWILSIKWINSLNPPITNVMAATGHVKKINIYTACIVICIIPITIFLLKLGLSPTTMYIAMLGLTIINQYACLRILCHTFKEVTMIEYAKEIVVPCLALTVASLILPVLACVLFRPTFWRLLLTGGLSLVSVLASTAFFLNKEEKQLAKSMTITVLKRLHIIKR